MKKKFTIYAIYYHAQTKEEYVEVVTSKNRIMVFDSLRDAYKCCANLASDYENDTKFTAQIDQPWRGYYYRLKYLSPFFDS